ncbi:multiprotein-bridging factor 1 family protein [Haloarculaceae archaeon H-GB2-1]|nr:multiprotein-bridging factor 1 family protein [Haloarculaceae archaeon H-GB1-1]MEA5387042.1 multiprotein-bridging factor 1 family protein [Haloarculaceae archaeon H-GB11]MEA5408545.1 multiprotein-bridging factor 1 family protein [Haloarculaceae archaeon H-GB2-1]
MAKYSTGSGGGSAGESCELCGSEDADLQRANVAGADLMVCSSCAQHDESGAKRDSGGESDRDRKRQAAQNTAKMQDARKGDSSHWEDGAGYDDDQLPYLVSDYGERVTAARQDAGLQIEELAEEIDVDQNDVLAVEQGRATQAGVGGTVIGKLETHLDIELTESS